MFFILPWKLRQANDSRAVPAANVVLIALNVLFYLLGRCYWVGPHTGLLSMLLYAFSHANFWHLFVNMWALWVFGNPVNRRLGNGYYLAAYLSSAVLLGLLARLLLSTPLVGSSGAVFAVMTIAMLLMPSAVLETAVVVLLPLSIIVGLISKPPDWLRWIIRWAIYPIPVLWALVLVPLMELFCYCCFWSPTHLAHLLGMLCGLIVVLLLPARITMGRRAAAGVGGNY
jgi:membrane associated rhomboid family serine protease